MTAHQSSDITPCTNFPSFLYYVYVCVVSLNLVRSESDVEDASLAFSPQFTHQVFGEKEMVVGYRNLKMKVHM